MVRDVDRSRTWWERLSFVVRGPGWAYRRHAEQAATAEPQSGTDPLGALVSG